MAPCFFVLAGLCLMCASSVRRADVATLFGGLQQTLRPTDIDDNGRASKAAALIEAGDDAILDASGGEASAPRAHYELSEAARAEAPESHECKERSYEQSARKQCDEMLWGIISRLYDEPEKSMCLYTDIKDLRPAWECYEQDLCYMIPPGPASLKLSFQEKDSSVSVLMDGDKQTKHRINTKDTEYWQWVVERFRWYSYNEWRQGLFRAFDRAMTKKGAQVTTYLGIHLDPGSAGGSGTTDPHFNGTLKENYPKGMFKSELWTLMHILRQAGEYQIPGVVWLRGEGKEGKPCFPAAVQPGPMVVPFDASYSGRQAAAVLADVGQRMPPHMKLYGVIGIATPQTFLDDKILSGFNVKMGRDDNKGLWAPQFKIPDDISMPEPVALLLKCSFCCSGKDVKRTPYKFYTQRRLSPARDCDAFSTGPRFFGFFFKEHTFTCSCDDHAGSRGAVFPFCTTCGQKSDEQELVLEQGPN